MNTKYALWIQSVLSVANEAAFAILDIYNAKTFQVKTKIDNSPVTEADVKSHQIIEKGLLAIDAKLPVLSEEGRDIPYSERAAWERYWLVDPLDGTKEFIRGTGEFTINIALIENHVPVLGVVLAPVLGQCYWAVAGEGAYYQGPEGHSMLIQANKKMSSPIKVTLSRRHHQEEEKLLPLLNYLENPEIVYCGSSLKICLVASGKADVYPRLGPTGEWDTAAGQCILEEAGGKLIDFQGDPFRYNTHETLENPGFLAISCVELLSYIVDKVEL